MAHPYSGKSQQSVGHSRAQSMTKGYARGGHVKGTKININILKSDPQGENRALPPPLTPAALGPAAAMAPPGPSPVPGVMPGGGAPPMPPPGMKRGGRVAKASGGPVKTPSPPRPQTPEPPMSGEFKRVMDEIKRQIEGAGPSTKARGGKVKMTGGAEGGAGRIQKAANAKRTRGG